MYFRLDCQHTPFPGSGKLFCDLFEVIAAFFQKKVCILEKDSDPFVGIRAAAVVDDAVVFCKHLMPKVACEKCTKVHVHFVHYCSGRAAGQATANISVISSF